MADTADKGVEPSRPTGPQLVKDGRYAVVGVLGEGSQGQTLDAVDKLEGRPVAIKRFSIRGAKSWKDVELAEREARVLSGLEHPMLPRYIDYFEENGALFLVMEKIEGKTLQQLREESALDQHLVVQLLNDAAELLDYLHTRSPPIIHRDIKPKNIILRPNGSFAFVDFGSVRDQLKPAGGSTVVGTFGFMAPEQFQGRALPASDVYGVGATVLAALSGQDPEHLPHQGLGIDVRAALGGQVDTRLATVLAAMLRPDPDQRASRIAPLLDGQRLRLPRGDTARAAAARAARSTPESRQHWSAPPRSTSHQASRQSPHARPSGPLGAEPAWARQPPRSRSYSVDASGDRFFRPWFFGNVFLLPAVFIAFEIAKLAIWGLFNVFLPTLLTVLSIFFGKPLRQAARRIDHVGLRGREGVRRAGRYMQARADQSAAVRHTAREQRRVRVARHRTRVSDEPPEPIESEAESEPPRQTRR